MLIVCNKCKCLKKVSKGNLICDDCKKIQLMTKEQEEELEEDLENLDEEVEDTDLEEGE